MDQARLDLCEVLIGYEARALELLDQGQGDPVAELLLQLLRCHADKASFLKRLVM